MKIYISSDFEGGTCVVGNLAQTPGTQYALAQRIITGEVNAAVEGCLAAGATDILVDDCHGGGINLLYEELHPEAKILLGAPRKRRFAPLDESFDAMMLIAYHPMAATEDGVLSHSYSSEAIHHMWLNGIEVGEIGLDAALAGSLGVPVVLVTSCVKGCEEARKILGNIETVAVKEGLGRNSAVCLHPKKACALIRQAAKRACKRASKIKPFTLKPPYELKIEYKIEPHAEGEGRLPGRKRINANTVVRTSNNIFDLI